MKNSLNQGNYYLGLDVGTNSVGWAVTDEKYNIKNAKGKALWGIRLFEEAKSAEERRTNRTARRRLERRNYRIKILELLFNDEISKIDPLFFKRMHNSFLYAEDKENGLGKYSLFNDSNFSDKDYMKKYPTIYHLRSAIIHDEKSYDIRLVYLALHSIMKSRGHFLFESNNDSEYLKPIDAMNDLKTILLSEYDIDFVPKDEKKYLEILSNGKLNITNKKKLLNEAYGSLFSESDAKVDIKSINNMLAGAKVKLSDLFLGDTLKENDINSLALSDNFEEIIDSLQKCLGDRLNLVEQLKTLYDCTKLSQILDKFEYLSDAKVELFNQNKSDLSKLKKYVRKYANNKYDEIFKYSKDKLNNYVAYNGTKKESGAYSCTQPDFCKYLSNVLKPLHNEDKEYTEICQKITDNTLITKLKGNENSIVPYQLHRMELIKILDNASKYLDFLNVVDIDGTSIKDKIIDTFEFKVPYYVGPLNKNSKNSWVIRKDEKITPWNFTNVVDKDESAKGFMTRLIGRCTYTGEDVLPKDSLLYSEYNVLNEINKIKVNGNPITVQQKKLIYEELFVNSNKKVTKKSIRENLISHGMPKADEITGIDDVIKSNLKSFHDFKSILNKYHDEDMVEDLIQSILIFGQDKNMLRKHIKSNYEALTDDEIKYICRLKYSEWGRLSKTLLTEIYTPNDVGEAINIITMLKETNNNLMELLYSEDYKFSENLQIYLNEHKKCSETLDEQLDELYISPAVRRSIRQTLKIVDEVVKVEKSIPKKIFIEVARGEEKEKQGKRTKSRKKQLIELYNNASKEESNPSFAYLESEDDSYLRRDKLYLYYTQFGKCMYSGEQIEIHDLFDNNKYDIDHIFPQSRIMDDSIDNRVLVKKQLNEAKGNIYPISDDIRNKMYSFWRSLYEKNLISQKKFNRLVRNSPLTADELSEFVSRQLTETQQSTKALAKLLEEQYPDSQIIYSKAKNVSEFRHKYDIIKCRDINDLHHAKDAYLNIVVGNVFHTKFTASFFKNIESLAKNNEYSLNKIFDYSTQGAWDKDKSIATVKNYVNKNNILFTRMPYMAKGALFDLTIMPKGKGQLPIKQGLPIEKYGGYNKISGCAFFAVEHTAKNKRIRTIEPIYLYKKDLFLNNPQKYCIEVLHLDNPKVISGIIRIDSLLELDGMREHISGRSDDRILFKHAYQFVTSEENIKYIKNIAKYLKRCSDAKKELPISFYDGISKDNNIKIYEELCVRMTGTIYEKFLKTMVMHMQSCKDKFKTLNEYEQAIIIMEIIKSLQCNAVNSNFDLLNGAKKVGIIRHSNNITNCESAYLINQSVTGIYETKIDLLA